ncbi:ribosome recycling factor family protein [Vibrio kyushuensis]|uniref:ribosome recycling factor family protein n=1 Tax=Vibrio kyushuensis TaxID=2910249 RepID=UPI003D0E061F
MTEKTARIQLPSLIHRIGGENVKYAKSIALKFDCELKRIRRSRNWSVTGLPSSLERLCQMLKNNDSESFLYLTKKVEETLPNLIVVEETLEAKLLRLITESPNVTLAELMQQTNCSISQARRARFSADIL